MGQSKLEVDLNMEELILFDVGKAYVGLLSDGYNADFSIDVRSMSLQGFNTFNAEDQWNILSVNYICQFPVDLVLSQTVLEKYKNIFRLIFPLKCVQYQLNAAWSSINNMARMQRHVFESSLILRLAGLRSKMSYVIDGLLSYFYHDVLEVRWAKLKESLGEIKEFEELRKNVAAYLESIHSHIFLNNNTIVNLVFAMVNKVKAFCLSCQIGEFDVAKMHEEFDDLATKFMARVEDLNNKSSSQYLSQLLVRMNFNKYFEDKANLMQMQLEDL